jgi:mono/diheme cytochrome c family protein
MRIFAHQDGGNMKKGWTWLSAAVLSTAALASACGGEKSTTPEPGAASSGGEPSLVITDQAEWDSLSAQGKTAFDGACGACHPGGEADLGPALKGHQESTADMLKQIRQGSGRMKPVGTDRLPESDEKALLVYLATLGAVGDVKGP